MTPATRGRAGWTFVDHVDRPLHGHARQPRRRRPRCPSIRVDLGATHRVARVDGQRVHARLRRASCSPAPRSATASAAAACSSSASRCSPPPRPQPRSRRASSALIVARAIQGIGAAFVTPLSLTLLSDAVPRAPARPRDRRVVRRHRPRRRARARRRRRDRRRPLVALDLLGQRPDRRSRCSRSPCARLAESRGPNRALDPRGLVLAGAGLLGLDLRDRARRRARLDQPDRARRGIAGGLVLLGRLRRLGGPRAAADAAAALLQGPHVLGDATACRSRCSSASSARSSSCRSSSRRWRATAAAGRACGSCRGRSCRSSSRRSPASSATGSARGR